MYSEVKTPLIHILVGACMIEHPLAQAILEKAVKEEYALAMLWTLMLSPGIV